MNQCGERWRVCDHGAFMYLFHADPLDSDKRDCFFQIQRRTATEAHIEARRHRNFSAFSVASLFGRKMSSRNIGFHEITPKASNATRPFHAAIEAMDAERLALLLTKLPRAERTRLSTLQSPCTLLAHAVCVEQSEAHRLVEVLLREAGIEQLTVPGYCDGWTPYLRVMAGPAAPSKDIYTYFAGPIPKGPLDEALAKVLLHYGLQLGLNVLLNSRKLKSAWDQNYQGRVSFLLMLGATLPDHASVACACMHAYRPVISAMKMSGMARMTADQIVTEDHMAAEALTKSRRHVRCATGY